MLKCSICLDYMGHYKQQEYLPYNKGIFKSIVVCSMEEKQFKITCKRKMMVVYMPMCLPIVCLLNWTKMQVGISNTHNANGVLHVCRVCVYLEDAKQRRYIGCGWSLLVITNGFMQGAVYIFNLFCEGVMLWFVMWNPLGISQFVCWDMESISDLSLLLLTGDLMECWHIWFWLVWATRLYSPTKHMDKHTSWHNGTNNAWTPLYLQYCGHASSHYLWRQILLVVRSRLQLP